MSSGLATERRGHAALKPSKPVGRYRPGIAPQGQALASDSDSDEEHEQAAQAEEAALEAEEAEDLGRQDLAVPAKAAKPSIRLRDVTLPAAQAQVDGSSSSEYETDSEAEAAATAKTSKVAPTAESSSEYETDSEDDVKPIYKPVFVPKRQRENGATNLPGVMSIEEQELDHQARLEAQRRESHALIAQSIQRELASKEKEEVFPGFDDRDGVDPTAEFEAWKLRELLRLQRDQAARYAREQEREEIERRRAMPEEVRLREDLERAEQSRQEKPKGSQAFLQKYHHKGAFYADDEILKRHDYTQATGATIKNASSLPAVMQKKNFGKAHQTKYTHLRDQDTSRPDAAGGGSSDRACFLCGQPGHVKSECPNAESMSKGPSGANAMPSLRPFGARPSNDHDRDDSFRDRSNGERRRDQRPGAYRDGRKRSASPRERYEDLDYDKRRRKRD
ncbi:uncharacterized protein L969DRAFT_18339 [Mixia osmundae IAM 14324]|uniref:CCHC-type domain-containing protein n=1 Tax=Mixia osmundae (strain CBS 9802 / IAM 14324 / JCM 22182 / KY 12970) TaxID=764103 RepID=G7E0F4_MIXOS|nr:uncharacterized protein L969DRAFT_18339 [Mixia osmundae IAM 14324]KEI38322.1 hypothetical protein L969DRAFT_18339 [Mixia osmundae IAM 14324]GAA96314.1 hypothetical protein E5Q_02980 [Mixia osmundae IAM 14324]